MESCVLSIDEVMQCRVRNGKIIADDGSGGIWERIVAICLKTFPT
jgi:hypothetical protein